MAIRLFILIWLIGWFFNLALLAWLLWPDARKQKRLPRLSESLSLFVGSFFSWPFAVPFGLWVLTLKPGNRQWQERMMDGRSPWPWWVTGLTLLSFAVLIGLWVTSVMILSRG